MADLRKQMELFKQYTQLKKEIRENEKEEKKDPFAVKMVIKSKEGDSEICLYNGHRQKMKVIWDILSEKEEEFDGPIIVSDSYCVVVARELKSSGKWVGNTLYYPEDASEVKISQIKKKFIALKFAFKGIQLLPIRLLEHNAIEVGQGSTASSAETVEKVGQGSTESSAETVEKVGQGSTESSTETVEKVGQGSTESAAETGKGKGKISEHVTHGYHTAKGKSAHPMKD